MQQLAHTLARAGPSGNIPRPDSSVQAPSSSSVPENSEASQFQFQPSHRNPQPVPVLQSSASASASLTVYSHCNPQSAKPALNILHHSPLLLLSPDALPTSHFPHPTSAVRPPAAPLCCHLPTPARTSHLTASRRCAGEPPSSSPHPFCAPPRYRDHRLVRTGTVPSSAISMRLPAWCRPCLEAIRRKHGSRCAIVLSHHALKLQLSHPQPNLTVQYATLVPGPRYRILLSRRRLSH